jgi:transcriptional regulator with XRE-family HTH domain
MSEHGLDHVIASSPKRVYFDRMINSAQCKMARVALSWNAAKLAQAAEVGVATVNRFEAGTGVPIPATLAAIQRALEAAGVEFIPENGGGAGVRLRKVST